MVQMSTLSVLCSCDCWGELHTIAINVCVCVCVCVHVSACMWYVHVCKYVCGSYTNIQKPYNKPLHNVHYKYYMSYPSWNA